VVGNTAIVFMPTSMQGLEGTGEGPIHRSTYVSVLVDDNWKLSSSHTSDTPFEK
jgi:hypothetical protein